MFSIMVSVSIVYGVGRFCVYLGEVNWRHKVQQSSGVPFSVGNWLMAFVDPGDRSIFPADEIGWHNFLYPYVRDKLGKIDMVW